MINLNIKHKVQISANFSADQWALYTSTIEKEEIDLCANHFNRWLEHYVNAGFGRREVEEKMHKIMSEFKNYGAFDSEPRGFLEVVLDKIYANT